MSVIHIPLQGAIFESTQQTVIEKSTAHASDIQAFRDSYNSEINAPSPPSEGFNFSEKITNSVSSVSDNLKTKFESISKLANQDTTVINTNQLLKIQLELSQLSLETQLFGDMVSKATKNLDQLTHLQ